MLLDGCGPFHCILMSINGCPQVVRHKNHIHYIGWNVWHLNAVASYPGCIIDFFRKINYN